MSGMSIPSPSEPLLGLLGLLLGLVVVRVAIELLLQRLHLGHRVAVHHDLAGW